MPKGKVVKEIKEIMEICLKQIKKYETVDIIADINVCDAVYKLRHRVECLTYALAVLERVEVDKLSDFIYDTIYEDRKPKQEISAGLECRLLAQAIVKELTGEVGK